MLKRLYLSDQGTRPYGEPFKFQILGECSKKNTNTEEFSIKMIWSIIAVYSIIFSNKQDLI